MRRVVVALALLVGALATWLLFRDDGTRTRTPVEFTPVQVQRQAVPSLAGRPAEASSPTSKQQPPGPLPSASSVRLFIEDGESGVRIPHAEVVVLDQEGAGSRPLAAPIVARSVSNENGFCSADVGTTSSVDVVVSAKGFATSRVHVPDLRPITVVRLLQGQVIAGTVKDPEGAPIEGIDVFAISQTLPEGSEEADVRSSDLGNVERDPTDASGRFTLRVPQGRYRIRVFGDGWLLKRDLSGPGRGDPLVESGTTELDLRVQPIRFFRARLVSAGSGLPIGVVPVHLGIFPGDKIERGDDPLAMTRQRIGPDWLSTRGYSPNDGIVTGAVRLLSATSIPQSATIFGQVDGFQSFSATVRLLRPSEFHSAKDLDEVRLQIDGEDRHGKVIASCSYEIPSSLLPPQVMYLQCTLPSGKTFKFSGKETQPGTWEFDGVPSGPQEIWLENGMARSSPLGIDVARGSDTAIRCELQQIAGVALFVTDESGHAILDAEVAEAPLSGQPEIRVRFASGRERTAKLPEGTATRAQAVPARIDPRAPESWAHSRFFRVPTGPRKIYISRVGFGVVEQEIDLRPGEIRELRVALKATN